MLFRSEKCIDLFKEIKEVSQLTAYCEINENYEGLDDESLQDDRFKSSPWANFAAWKNEELDNLWAKLRPITDSKFKRVMIGQTEHIWIAFKELFGGSKTK